MKKESSVVAKAATVAPLGRRAGILVATVLMIWSVGLLGASCDKKANPAEPGPVGIEPPPDPGKQPGGPGAGTGAAPAASTEPVAGVDLDKLGQGQRAAFHQLVDKLPSPCGKAEPLRASVKDPSCKRAPFAARYLARKLAEDLGPDEIGKAYEGRYLAERKFGFDVKDAPSLGLASAPVTVVEFFDYGCPHCKLFTPILEDVAAEFPEGLAIYYKHFPLSSHTNSIPAAMAAVAAHKQGKFKAMHKALMDHQEAQTPADIERYAAGAGLDMKRWKADMADPKTRARVEADRAEGEKSDLRGTPQLYVGGHKWPEDDPLSGEELIEWVREELAVNR